MIYGAVPLREKITRKDAEAKNLQQSSIIFDFIIKNIALHQKFES